ncbi:energy-coupling factor transporter transmembrane component T [Marinicrinis sediminis]|uniref:Energy-coupling factor transporter transmembrane component T n=1 Tax=Marinicrinis sediminis TaxID=1652465 RepID=A0ABW5R7M3_9BACL
MISYGFRHLHPLTGWLYMLVSAGTIMLFFHPLLLLGVALVQAALHLVWHGLSGSGRRFLLLLVVWLFVTLMNPLFNHRGAMILFYFMDQPITGEAVWYGATNGLLIVSMLLLFVNMQAILSTPKLLYLFARVSPKVTLILSLAVRFVPLYRKRLKSIAQVHAARGMSIRQGPRKQRMQNGMKQVQTLLSWSMESAVQTADSMAARGYGSGHRTSYARYRWSVADSVHAAGFVVLVTALLTGWMLQHGRLEIYPVMEQEMMHSGDGWMMGLLLMLHALPLWMETREGLRWR